MYTIPVYPTIFHLEISKVGESGINHFFHRHHSRNAILWLWFGIV